MTVNMPLLASLLVLIIVGSVITMGYFLKLQRTVCYNRSAEPAKLHESPVGMLASMTVLAFAAVLAGTLLFSGIRHCCLDRAVDVVENFSYIDIERGD